jgi:hypothetical protein
MRWTEELVPIDQRYLTLFGLVSPASMELVEAALPADRPATSRVCFVGYSYADLPLPKRFTILFAMDKPETGVKTEIVIIAATQQLAVSSEEIPHGWKTICVIDFPLGVPPIVDDLPTLNSWKGSPRLGLCEGYAYRMIAQSLGRSRTPDRG